MAGDRPPHGPGTWTGGPRACRGLSLSVRLSSNVVCRLPAELLGLASSDVSLTVAYKEVRRDEAPCIIFPWSLVDSLMMGTQDASLFNVSRIPQHPLLPHQQSLGPLRAVTANVKQVLCSLWAA